MPLSSTLPLANKVPSLGKDKPRFGCFHTCASGLLKRERVPLVLMHLCPTSVGGYLWRAGPALCPEDTALAEFTCSSFWRKVYLHNAAPPWNFHFSLYNVPAGLGATYGKGMWPLHLPLSLQSGCFTCAQSTPLSRTPPLLVSRHSLFLP